MFVKPVGTFRIRDWGSSPLEADVLAWCEDLLRESVEDDVMLMMFLHGKHVVFSASLPLTATDTDDLNYRVPLTRLVREMIEDNTGEYTDARNARSMAILRSDLQSCLTMVDRALRPPRVKHPKMEATP